MSKTATRPTALALTPAELRHSRYADALYAFRLSTCLRMSSGDDSGEPADDDALPAFPPRTRPEDMTDAERAAYYQHQARRHEDRNKDLLRITGGKYGDELRALLDERQALLDASRTETEKAVATAAKEARDKALAEVAPRLVTMAFNVALAELPEDDRKELIETLDPTKFVDQDGNVDTDKVRSVAERIAPAVKGSGERQDYGAGKRGTPPKSGVSVGAEMFAASRKKPTTH